MFADMPEEPLAEKVAEFLERGPLPESELARYDAVAANERWLAESGLVAGDLAGDAAQLGALEADLRRLRVRRAREREWNDGAFERPRPHQAFAPRLRAATGSGTSSSVSPRGFRKECTSPQGLH